MLKTPRPPRLKFIDLARAIAILLMLEGHFVGLTLAAKFCDPSNELYNFWREVRGFSAPLFFTVAGMIFTFLLSGDVEGKFFGRVRVRKGLRRVAELFFWGYLLQLSLKNFGDYLRFDFADWVYAFHVLQCIGAGLLGLIAVAWVQSLLPRVGLYWFYGVAMVVAVAGFLWLKCVPGDGYLPSGWPQVFQNLVRGPRSVFPLVPWLGFVFLGGAMGVAVRRYQSHLTTAKSCLWFFGLAGVLKLVWLAAIGLGEVVGFSSVDVAWFTNRAFQVVTFLGVLRWIEVRYGIGVPRLLCCGRLTLEIYVVHVVVLSGGVFGIGLDQVLVGRLSPWQAVLGAVIFMGVFFAFAQVWDWRRVKFSPKKTGGA